MGTKVKNFNGYYSKNFNWYCSKKNLMVTVVKFLMGIVVKILMGTVETYEALFDQLSFSAVKRLLYCDGQLQARGEAEFAYFITAATNVRVSDGKKSCAFSIPIEKHTFSSVFAS